MMLRQPVFLILLTTLVLFSTLAYSSDAVDSGADINPVHVIASTVTLPNSITSPKSIDLPKTLTFPKLIQGKPFVASTGKSSGTSINPIFLAENPAPTPIASSPSGQAMDDTVRLLQGQWRGNVDVNYLAITQHCELGNRSYHFALALKVGGIDNPNSMLDNNRNFLATGTLAFDQPVEKLAPGCDPDYMLPVISLKAPTASVRTLGMFYDKEIMLNKWEGAPEKPYTATFEGHEMPEMEGENYQFPIQLESVATDKFTVGYHGTTSEALRSIGITKTDPDNQMTITVSGSFARIGAVPKWVPTDGGNGNQHNPTPDKSAIAKLLAALLLYLGALLPGMFMNPESSDLTSLFGTLVGSLEALKGLGFGALASQARLAGFAGGALAEAFELARVYENSTVEGESAGTTAERLAVSAIPDIAAFAVSAVVTEAAIGVAMTAAPIIGAVGAGAVAVGGAALITYGVSAGATAVKTWLTGILF